MVHPLVLQLRFARSEFRRGLAGLTDEEARRRFAPMNCISWTIGHLAWQEQRYWLGLAQGRTLLPEVSEMFASGGPSSTPGLAEMWEAWEMITGAADLWLEGITPQKLEELVVLEGKPSRFLFGSLLLRMIYHYWFHLGECMAVRQMLGHGDLPQFVGDIDGQAPYGGGWDADARAVDGGTDVRAGGGGR